VGDIFEQVDTNRGSPPTRAWEVVNVTRSDQVDPTPVAKRSSWQLAHQEARRLHPCSPKIMARNDQTNGAPA